MLKYGLLSILTAMLCGQLSALAQETVEITLEPVVVTATRIEIPVEHVGKAVMIITAEQLEMRKAASLADALRSVPGLLVRQQRGPGGLTSLKIRGLDSEYTQILIDGLPVRDPSDPQGAAGEFMNDILLEHIERIEIVRGASSTLYGSDSVGGTINIITKKGCETPEMFAAFEGGSMSTYQEVAGLRGIAGPVNYTLTGKRVDSAGIDAHDTYGETAITGRFGFNILDDMSLAATFKYVDADVDINDTPAIDSGVLIKDQDDPDDTKEKTVMSGGVSVAHQPLDDMEYTLKLGYVDIERRFLSGPEGDESGFGSDTTYSGNTLNAELQVNYTLNDTHVLTGGYEYEAEEFEQRLGDRTDTPDATRQALYLQDSLFLLDDAFNVVPGVRYVDHDQAGSRVDWEVSASYLIEKTGARLHSHIGTGFRAPSLYELYGASVFGGSLYEFGNRDLKPEESLGWDAGIELKLFEDRLLVDATYFRNEFDTIIAFGTVGYENVDGGKTQGGEIMLTWSPLETLQITGTYTYTDTEDANGEQFFGVPEHEVGFALTYTFLEHINATLAVTRRGAEDIPLFDPSTFVSERYKNDGYTKIDATVGYVLNRHCQFWLRGENLFDEHYTVGGYEAPGLSAYGGVKLML